MSMAMEDNSAADANSRKKELRKTFNILKTHASAVANFTLQWQELEDHFISLQNTIQSKLQTLQSHQNPSTLNTQLKSHSNSKETNLVLAVEPKPQSSETQLNSLKALVGTEQSSPENTSFNGIPVRDGKALLELVFLNEHLKERSSLRSDILDTLKASSNSGKLVLEAVSGFFPSESKTEGTESVVSGVRRSCLLLLEEFLKLKFVVSPQLRKEAKKLALEWKAKMKVEPLNPSEVWGFLLLLGIYGLVGEFDKDEILKLFGSVVQRKQAPEVFMSLGYADKASDLIGKLISEKKQPDAVRFIYAFELVDKFPPVPLLEAHLNQFQKVAKVGSKKGKNSSKSQDDTTKKEVNALRSVIRCIESYNLGSQYSPDTLRKRIDWLINQKKENKTTNKDATTKTPGSKSQSQRLAGKKRAASDSKNQSNNQNRKKNPRTAWTVPTATALNHSLGASAAGHHHLMHHRSPHQPVALYERQATRYLIPSSEMVAPAPADPNTYGAASNFSTVEASHHQPAGSYIDQGAQYSAGQYSLAHSIPDTYRNLSSGTYGSGGSHTQHVKLTSAAYGLGGSTVPPHGSLTSGAYRLAGSIPVNHQISPTASHYELVGSGSVKQHVNSLVERYEPSIDASGRHHGSSGLPTSMGVASDAASLAYHPMDRLRISSYNDRPAPPSGYNALPNHYHTVYRL